MHVINIQVRATNRIISSQQINYHNIIIQKFRLYCKITLG